MNTSQKPIYIDVREPSEFAGGHIAGAINIPLGSIADGATSLASIDQNAEIIVYCRSGGRAENAKAQLEALGYTNVTNGINQSSLKAGE